MSVKSVTPRVKKLRQLVDSLGPSADFHKLHGILDALEMQTEDGNYRRNAVTRLCEALLATTELYEIPERIASRIEEAACALVSVVEDGR